MLVSNSKISYVTLDVSRRRNGWPPRKLAERKRKSKEKKRRRK
jgi:hypothetical protein